MVSRSEHRYSTLRRLEEAALLEFERNGDKTSIGQIAETAGLSRRTVHRYVTSREELLFLHQLVWLDVFETALANTADTPIADRIRLASRAIALHIDSDPVLVRRSMSLVGSYPNLMTGNLAAMATWVERVAAEVMGGPAESVNQTTRFRARVIGAAVMGMVDAVLREWHASGGEASFVNLYDRGFSLVEPLFDE